MSESNESNPDLTPEERVEDILEIPAFQNERVRPIAKLNAALRNPGKAGGTSSELDPVNGNAGDLRKGLGVPTRPNQSSDITPPSKDTWEPGRKWK